MGQFQRFLSTVCATKREDPVGISSPELNSRSDPSCLKSLVRYCCPCCCSSEEPKKPASKVNDILNSNDALENANNRSGRDASSDHATHDIVNHALPDNAPPVPCNQIPQTGFAMPKGKYKSRNGDDKAAAKAAESSTGTATPGSDQEQAPAKANEMMIEKDILEDRHPSSHGSIEPRDHELKSSDTRKMHGKGYDYDNSTVSSQATQANQMIAKEKEDKPHASSHGSVKHKGELEPIDRGRLGGKGYDCDDSLVSSQATKEDQMIEKEREDKYPLTHGSVKLKGELKPIDRGRDSLLSPQTTKDAINSKQQTESHHISPQATKDARDSKLQIEKHQEVSRGMKGKHHLADGDLQDD